MRRSSGTSARRIPSWPGRCRVTTFSRWPRTPNDAHHGRRARAQERFLRVATGDCTASGGAASLGMDGNGSVAAVRSTVDAGGAA